MKTDAPSKPTPRPAEPSRRQSKHRSAEQRLTGIPVSPGIVIGRIYDTTEAPAEAPRRAITEGEAEAERTRLAEAAALSRKQVSTLKTRLSVLPEEAQAELEELARRFADVRVVDTSPVFNSDWTHAMELGAMLDVGRAVVAAALAREESRGAHQRLDFPEASGQPRHSLVTRGSGGEPVVAFTDVVSNPGVVK
jgi:succinate dehydrogenase/fumarate reductase flavoprotein subunit